MRERQSREGLKHISSSICSSGIATTRHRMALIAERERRGNGNWERNGSGLWFLGRMEERKELVGVDSWWLHGGNDIVCGGEGGRGEGGYGVVITFRCCDGCRKYR